MLIQHVVVCTFNTSPCISATRARRYTWRRVERTHDDVLNLHTGFFSVSHTTHTPHTPHTPPHARQREKRKRKRRIHDKTEDTRPKTQDRRQKTEDRRQRTEERGERREERRREKMKETRKEIRRSRYQQKMKLNCLINCPPSGN